MPCDYITREATLIADNLIIRVVDDKTLRSRDGAVVESIAYSSAATHRAFRIMAICDMYTEMTSISQYVNDGLSMMKYQGHKVPKAFISIHAYCSLSHCVVIR